jgi:hypothetical protein
MFDYTYELKQFFLLNIQLGNIYYSINNRGRRDRDRERVIDIAFTATFNNISAIMWRSVLLEEETRLPGENQRPATRH